MTAVARSRCSAPTPRPARCAGSRGMVQSQAMVMAFADIFLILAVLFAAMILLVPLVRAPKAGAGAAAH